MDGPPKAMCQAYRHSYHDEDHSPHQTSMCQRVAHHHHALSPKIMTLSQKMEHFAPPGKIVWKVMSGLGCPNHHQYFPSQLSLIWHVGPWHPTCGLVAHGSPS
jgi:hypothetical protein